jgi:hypothetical protein
LNPDIQERVWAEINTAMEKDGGNMTHESIFETKFLINFVNGEWTEPKGKAKVDTKINWLK